jgi:hypothetical protein
MDAQLTNVQRELQEATSSALQLMKYNFLSALMVIPAHQMRHMWQVEEILKTFS